MKISALVVTMVMAVVIAFVAMPTPAAPAVHALDASTFKVDPVHSTVHYKIRHIEVSNFYGRFNDFGGTFSFDPADPSAATFDMYVEATSVDTGNENRDKHLRSADFFDVADYSKITFKSTDVAATDKEGMFEMTGELTLLGTTKTITVPLEWFGTVENERMGVVAGFESIFTVKRSDFGMSYGVDGGALGDEVTLIIAMEGRRQNSEE